MNPVASLRKHPVTIAFLVALAAPPLVIWWLTRPPPPTLHPDSAQPKLTPAVAVTPAFVLDPI